MKRLTLTVGLLALAAVLAACSGTTAAPATKSPAPAGSPNGSGTTIVARDMKFSQSAVTVKANQAFDLTFDNQDGAPHDVAISDASGKGVFKGEIVSSKAVVYQVPALAPGAYAFICEVHPDMKGTITAN